MLTFVLGELDLGSVSDSRDGGCGVPYSTVVGFGVPPCCTWLQDPVLCGCEAGAYPPPLLSST